AIDHATGHLERARAEAVTELPHQDHLVGGSERDDVAPVGRLEDVKLVLLVVAREAAAVAAQREDTALVDDVGRDALPRVQRTPAAHDSAPCGRPPKRRGYSIAGQ